MLNIWTICPSRPTPTLCAQTGQTRCSVLGFHGGRRQERKHCKLVPLVCSDHLSLVPPPAYPCGKSLGAGKGLWGLEGCRTQEKWAGGCLCQLQGNQHLRGTEALRG